MQQNKNIIVLSCSRNKPLLTETLLEEVNYVSKYPSKVLWPKISSEFYINYSENTKDVLKKIQNICKGKEIDLNLVQNDKNNTRRKKLLLADMDSTLVMHETLDEIASLIGIGKEVKKITALAMEGKLNFTQSFIRRVELLKNQPSDLINIIKEKIIYNNGARELIDTMRRNGSKCAMVTGGFKIIAQKVKEDLGIDYLQANDLEILNGKITGKVKFPIYDSNSKLEKLLYLAKELKISLQNTCAIGDGSNDIAMIKRSGMGVSFRGKSHLKRYSRYNLDFSDLTGLLFLQGYTKEDIQIKS